MKYLIGCAITLTVILFPSVAHAQFSPEIQRQCDAAFANASQILRDNNRQLIVVDSGFSRIAEVYSVYPEEKPVEFSVVLDGRDADDVMMSPELLTTISRTIIEGCSPIGMVSFVRAETDWVTSFGLVNGRVREFECIDPGGNILPPWGSRVCI